MGTLAALTYETLIAACGWLILAAAMVLLMRAVIGDRARGRRRCGKCWYDMAGVPGLTCPECGRVHKRERALGRSRRSRKLIALALMGAILGFSVSQVWFWKTGAFLDYVPRWALSAAAWTQAERAEKAYGRAPSRGAAFFGSWGPAPSATTPDLSSRWDGILACWHAGRVLDQYAATPGPHAASMVREASEVLVSFEITDARMGMKPLGRAIQATHWEKPLDAVGVLAANGNALAVQWLEAVVLDRRDHSRSATAGSLLGHAAGLQTAALESLARVVQHPLGQETAAAITQTIEHGFEAERSLKVIELLLTSPHPSVRQGCLAGLQNHTPTSRYEHLIWPLLQGDPSPDVRAAAARSRWRPQGLMDKWGQALIGACEDQETLVANAAISSLLDWACLAEWSEAQFAKWLQERDASQPLPSGRSRDPFEWISKQRTSEDDESRHARLLFRFTPQDQRVLDWYRWAALSHENYSVRESAFLAISEMRAPIAWHVAVASDSLKAERVGDVRASAVASLESIVDTRDQCALASIALALRDEYPRVQYAAVGICERRVIVDGECLAALRVLSQGDEAGLANTARRALARAQQAQSRFE